MKNKLKIVVPIIVALLLGGCSKSENTFFAKIQNKKLLSQMRNINVGMSKKDVILVLGEKYNIRSSSCIANNKIREILEYQYKYDNQWTFESKTEIFWLEFINSKLVSIGKPADFLDRRSHHITEIRYR